MSRKDVGTRELDIEEETAAWLRRRGIKVEVLRMGQMPFAEQVAAAARANILVAAHGAGLVHSLFMPPEAVVIEITWPRGEWPPHYRNLARYLGRQYMLIEAEGKPMVRPAAIHLQLCLAASSPIHCCVAVDSGVLTSAGWPLPRVRHFRRSTTKERRRICG